MTDFTLFNTKRHSMRFFNLKDKDLDVYSSDMRFKDTFSYIAISDAEFDMLMDMLPAIQLLDPKERAVYFFSLFPHYLTTPRVNMLKNLKSPLLSQLQTI